MANGVYTSPIRRLNGSMGHLQINGLDWGDVEAVQIQVEIEYADVRMGMDTGKKMTGRSGTGSITLKRAYSRSADILQSVQEGRQPLARLVAWIEDPDAEGGQEERVAIDNICFTTIDILSFTHGELVGQELPFTFAPCDLRYLDRIEQPGFTG